jgi:hypothetical protein
MAAIDLIPNKKIYASDDQMLTLTTDDPPSWRSCSIGGDLLFLIDVLQAGLLRRFILASCSGRSVVSRLQLWPIPEHYT